MPSPVDILRSHWGYTHFYPEQEKAISTVLEGKNVITLLPTGGGKSICFQIPALVRKGICIVISPLISLMQDQVKNLNSRGIKAMMLGGKLSFYELSTLLDNCRYGNYKFLYLSPERLQQDLVQERIQAMDVNLIAIDEAHCISEWGHDFRPSYRKINLLLSLLPQTPCIALTATATPRVLQDIQENLQLEDAAIVRKSFNRPNLQISIKKTEDKYFELQRFFTQNSGISIVYVRSRRLTVELKEFLKVQGFSARAFHGGMTTEQKESALEEWQAEKFEIMVATTAFGMGIDKANVRQVVHFQLPDSLESYYQEIGRAGRDGKPAKVYLIYNKADILGLKDQFLKNAPTPETTKFIYKKLNSYLSIPYGEGTEKEYNFNFLAFCQTYHLNTYLVFNTLQLLDQFGLLSLSKEFRQRTELYFKISPQVLHRFILEHPKYEKLIQALLRMQGGFFEYLTAINLHILKDRTQMSRSEINFLLKKLEELEIIELTLADQDSTVHFSVPREDDFTVNPWARSIRQQYESKKNKIAEVIRYIRDEKHCKINLLLTYFGEKASEDCGHCSYCRKDKGYSKKKEQQSKIRNALSQQLAIKSMSSKDLVLSLDFPEKNILFVLERMLDKKEIIRTPENKYTLND